MSFAVENLQALFRNVVRRDVIDRDLQIIEPGFVQLFDLFGLKIIAVRDQPGDHPVMPDAGDDVVDLGVHHRFAAGDRDDRAAKFGKLIDPLEHYVDRHRIARLVVFVAVRARQIAPPHRHDVHQYRMFCRANARTVCLTPRVNLLKLLAFGIVKNRGR